MLEGNGSKGVGKHISAYLSNDRGAAFFFLVFEDRSSMSVIQPSQ